MPDRFATVPVSLGELHHFSTAVDDDGVLLAGFDYLDRPVNVLNTDSVAEWGKIVRFVEQSPAIIGAVLLSLKEGNFCAGADLEQMHRAQDRSSFQDVDDLVVTVHHLFDSMERSTKPFVAAVEGPCLGGGLELMLACHARLASTHSRTCFALPEVKLGLLPGFGGTQRLPRLIGLPAALAMITTGKTISPREALRMGLIDEIVASVSSDVRTMDRVRHETLIKAAAAKVLALRSARPRRRLHSAPWFLGLPGIRTLVCRAAIRRVAERVGDFYPAPLRAIEAVQQGMSVNVLEGSLRIERPLLINLMAGRTCRYLVGLFLAGERIKRNAVPSPTPLTRVGVLGAGLMGSQIAGQLAEKGHAVVLRDIDPTTLAHAMGWIHKAQEAQVRKRLIPPSVMRFRLSQVAPTLRMDDIGTTPLVIEAVSEKLDVKRAVLEEFESYAPPDAIFATNTSSYTLADIAAGASHPERCVGLHFFNPVAKMQLVEVVRAPFTSDHALAHACSLAKRLGKFPLVVQDGPGFLVNRILSRYLAEAVILVDEGVSIRRIDEAAKRFGMAVDSGHPMGPLELIDLIGLPVAIHVLRSLAVLGSRLESREALLQRFLPDGQRPVTFWKGGKENPDALHAIKRSGRAAAPEGTPISDDLLTQRLFLPMVDEAVRCLHDRIVEHPWQIDFALVYGIGFPAFRGGLLSWARETMTPEVVAGNLELLATKYGKRFEPCAGLSNGGW